MNKKISIQFFLSFFSIFFLDGNIYALPLTDQIDDSFNTSSQESFKDCADELPNYYKYYDLLKFALCHNSESKIAWANVRYQAAQVGINEASFYPNVSANYNSAKNIESTAIVNYPQFSSDGKSVSAGRSINLNWTLYDFGERRAILENSRQLYFAALANKDASIQNVFFVASKAFYNLQASASRQKSAADYLKIAEEIYKISAEKYESGIGNLSDKLQTKAKFSKAQLDNSRAIGDFRIAQGNLSVAIGLAPQTVIPIAETSDLPNIDVDINYVENQIRREQDKNPVIAEAEYQFSAAQKNLAAVKSQKFPVISLSSGISRNRQLGEFATNTLYNTKSIGIQINFPIFSGFSYHYQIQAAQIQVDEKKLNLENIRLSVSSKIWNSYQDLITTYRNFRISSDYLNDAENSFYLLEGKYKSGVGDLVDLLSAQNDFNEAKKQYIQSILDCRLAMVTFDYSLAAAPHFSK